MTYCGAIGSVNVLSFMSTDLFDESQENPFLLTAAKAEAPTKPSASPSRASFAPLAKPTSAELPLDDTPPPRPAFFGLSVKTETAGDAEPASPHQYSPGRTVQFSGASPLRSILKRQSSVDSTASTAASAADYHAAVLEQQQQQQFAPPLPYQYQPASAPEATEQPFLTTDSELHKLLYSLTRFGLASDTSASNPGSPPSPSKPRGVSFASGMQWQPPPPPQQQTADKKRRARSKRAASVKAASESGDHAAFAAAARARGSVTYATVKNLLRGGSGGRGASPSRTTPRSVPDFRRKSMGTVSSRLKRRQKFARPTILTDAYHRVCVPSSFPVLLPSHSTLTAFTFPLSCLPPSRSDMKLGTKPMSTAIKHLAFPCAWGEGIEDQPEADPGMPSPKGQLHRQSLVSLETLDKIGTRAACPVHLIDEAAPDFSHVRARVDSYNHLRSPSRSLRRPSAWLAACVVDTDDGHEEEETEDDALEYGEGFEQQPGGDDDDLRY